MFGGTKGKFNGLAFLLDDPQAPRGKPPPENFRRGQRANMGDDYYYDEDDMPRRPFQYDNINGGGDGKGPPYTRLESQSPDDDDYPPHFAADANRKYYFVTPPNDLPIIRVEENLKPEFRQSEAQDLLRQRRRDAQNIWQGGDILNSQDGYAYNGASRRRRNNNNNDEDSPLKSFFNTLTQKNNKRNFSYIQNNDNTISKLSLNNGQHIKYNNKEECILKNDINNTFSNNNNKHKSKELLKPNDDELIYVPCINCSNMISIDFIESHTDICNVTTDEQNNLDNINNEFSTINFKLMKLKDHLENIKLNSNLLYNKETYIVEIVDQTLKDAIHIAKIDSNSVNNLKKFLTNLEVI